MIDDQFVLGVERLRDALRQLKSDLREKIKDPQRQVTSADLKAGAAKLAEIWLVSVASRPELTDVISLDYLADLNVHFQRLLTFSERAVTRSRYDMEINAIVADFTARFVIPLKQLRNRPAVGLPPAAARPPIAVGGASAQETGKLSAFLGHSFAKADEIVVECVTKTLQSLGVVVTSGRKPKADRISEKVRKLIDAQPLFVGLFTRGEKIAKKQEWTTSAWVIDEKAYASAKGKKLILIKEEGVQSIGGIQGDYEFVELDRNRLDKVVLSLIELFELDNNGLRG